MKVLRKLGLAVGWVGVAFLAVGLVVIVAGDVFGLALIVYELIR